MTSAHARNVVYLLSPFLWAHGRVHDERSALFTFQFYYFSLWRFAFDGLPFRGDGIARIRFFFRILSLNVPYTLYTQSRTSTSCKYLFFLGGVFSFVFPPSRRGPRFALLVYARLRNRTRSPTRNILECVAYVPGSAICDHRFRLRASPT